MWESFTGLVLSLFLCTSGDFFFLYYCIFVLIVAVLTHIYYFLCSFGVYLTSFKNRNQTKNYFLVSPHTKGSQGLFCLMHIGVSARCHLYTLGPWYPQSLHLKSQPTVAWNRGKIPKSSQKQNLNLPLAGIIFITFMLCYFISNLEMV